MPEDDLKRVFKRIYKFHTHGNCVNFSGGFCTLNIVAVDPNGAACPNFIPKSITVQPKPDTAMLSSTPTALGQGSAVFNYARAWMFVLLTRLLDARATIQRIVKSRLDQLKAATMTKNVIPLFLRKRLFLFQTGVLTY